MFQYKKFIGVIIALVSFMIIGCSDNAEKDERLLSGLAVKGVVYGLFPYDIRISTVEEADGTILYNADVHTGIFQELTYTPTVGKADSVLTIDGAQAVSGQTYTLSLADVSDDTSVSVSINVTSASGEVEKNLLVVTPKDLTTVYASEKINDDLIRIMDFGGNPGTEDMWLILGNEKAMLVDCGNAGGDLADYVKSLTDLPVEVFISHGHPDHIAQFPQMISEGYTIHMSSIDQSWTDGTITDYSSFEWAEEGDVFDLGGRSLEVVAVPGHTSGSMALIDKDSEDVFISDAIGSGQVWMYFVGNDPLEEYLPSLQNLKSKIGSFTNIKFRVGHSYQLTEPLEGEVGMQYLNDMISLVDGILDGTIVGEANAFKPAFSPDRVFVASFGTASILYDPDNLVGDK